MRALVQRVNSASVKVNGKLKGEINKGLLVFLGIHEDDTKEDVYYIFKKIKNLRIFEDEEGKMNKSILKNGGNILLISQFTLHANTQKGNRPSFNEAASRKKAEKLYDYFIKYSTDNGFPDIQSGKFGGYMQVESCNDGPVTIMIKSKRESE